MSENEAVSPLRITKTPSTPSRPALSRPLSDISSTERRRNSPSFDQTSKKMMFTKESSPFDSSPFNNSPRLFWKDHTASSPRSRFSSENEFERDPSLPLSPKRSSIENLKKASRVKNSSMFAREQKNEYDPTAVKPLDRPLAAGRPLSVAVQGNAFGGSGLTGLRQQNDEFKGHRRGDSLSKIPTLASPAKLGSPYSFPPKDRGPSPSEGRASPTKSSLVSHGRFNSTPDTSILSEEGDTVQQTPRPLRRHAKSVTFDAAPPIINEYEMVTPDPSAASDSREGSYECEDEEDEEEDEDEEEHDESFDHGSVDQDDSFDASLEDTQKTPVVLPEDWRDMTPDVADTSLADTFEDPFSGDERGRHGSITSDGSSRPLPPLPSTPMETNKDRCRRDSSIGLSAAAERASGAHRSLPQPPRAAGVSKSDILNMRDGSMSLEDRLRLMGIEDRQTTTPTLTQESLKKAELGLAIEITELELDDVTESEPQEFEIPRISRESIRRRMKSPDFDDYEEGYDAESSPERSYGDLDPDYPIPSREVSSNFDDCPQDAPGQQSEADSVLDAYSVNEPTEVYEEAETSHVEDNERESSVVRHEVNAYAEDDDEASQYSDQPPELQPNSQSTVDSDGPPTPTGLEELSLLLDKDANTSYPELSSFGDSDFKLHLDPYNASSDPVSANNVGAMRDFLQRPHTPEDGDIPEEEAGTPDSVIRHPVVIEPPERTSPIVPDVSATVKAPGAKLKTRPSLAPSDVETMAATRRAVSGEHAPPVPERSPKRQSLSLEFDSVEEDAAQQEKNDGSHLLDIPIGDIAEDLSLGLDKEFDHIIEAQKVDKLFPLPSFAYFPTSCAALSDGAEHMSGEGFTYRYSPTNGYVREQKGYLMRQNTKIVVASNRQFSDEQPPADVARPGHKRSQSDNPAASRKTSDERKPAWTTEPWNSKARRRSLRTVSGSRRIAAPPSGTAPPLPGQESAVAGGLDSVAEGNDAEGDIEEGTERGRLFVKVVGVKDLDLPLPKTERTYFQLTLDNGLHCVTTDWTQLGHSARIGQEFELVVLDDLEFQFTLQTKIERPPEPQQIVASPSKPIINHKKSGSAFRNLLSSPKKRKEQERKQQEEEKREAQRLQQEAQEAQVQRNKPATAWDLLHNLVGPDGSFARAYVCLKNYESQAYGRPCTVDVPCFNEWAVDESGPNSVKSKRGGVVRRPPYRVGKLTLELCYVPRPKKALDKDMPKSMNACIRQLKEAEEIQQKSYEGHLSQQGGDCPYWRRRFFRLEGTKLTAYHETTRQPRATINLAKASKLIDDKSALTQPSTTKSGGRRKSAFAEEEEGYMFVEEGFRIRFANGEVIDFYADNAQQKDGWMQVLSQTVGKDVNSGKAWTQMVLDYERKNKMRSSLAPQLVQAKALKDSDTTTSAREQIERRRSQIAQPGSGARTAPSSPQKQDRARQPPPPVEKDERHQQAGRPRGNTGAMQALHVKDATPKHPPVGRPRAQTGGRRDQVRSMLF
ncbi:DUF1709-domain-containing protein [Delitschia confertaspora ATCC 74209]|uniref:DUF1709-domain-containing protein n=1 Tax=Delitschia confertaspora ATCC 74209 TaxID=1513339 RepID=A0A9P4JW22_9PLEO|nr:DUF1709-domain-containing protein [Delitschia confertaspora ATCC 74209]